MLNARPHSALSPPGKGESFASRSQTCNEICSMVIRRAKDRQYCSLSWGRGSGRGRVSQTIFVFVSAWIAGFAQPEITADCYRRPPGRRLHCTLVESAQKTNTHDTRTTDQSARRILATGKPAGAGVGFSRGKVQRLKIFDSGPRTFRPRRPVTSQPD